MNAKLEILIAHLDRVIKREQANVESYRSSESVDYLRGVADGKESVLADVIFIREQLAEANWINE